MASELQPKPGPHPTSWDVPEILHRLVSPLTYCGLVALCVTTIVGMVLYTDMPYQDRFTIAGLGLACLLLCFWGVARHTRSIQDLVADVGYYKKELETTNKLVTGRALTDLINDRIEVWVTDHRDKKILTRLARAKGPVAIEESAPPASRTAIPAHRPISPDRGRIFENQSELSE